MEKPDWVRCVNGHYVNYNALCLIKVVAEPTFDDIGKPVLDDNKSVVQGVIAKRIDVAPTYKIELYSGTKEECDVYLLNLIHGNVDRAGRVFHGFPKDVTEKLIKEMNADVN